MVLMRCSSNSIGGTVLLMLLTAVSTSACGDAAALDAGQKCTSDFQCAQGEYCDDGVCAEIGGDKDPKICGSDDNCADDEHCEGVCV